MKTVLISLINVLILLVPFFCAFPSTNAEYDHDDIFKLSPTPFVNSGKLLTMSYGLNYGLPSLLLAEWQIPNKRKFAKFWATEYKISFLRISASIGTIYTSSWAYNWSAQGEEYDQRHSLFRVGCKVLRNRGYFPDIGIEINSLHGISLSIGESREKFRYYGCVDLLFYYYIPILTRCTVGVSQEMSEKLGFVLEYSKEPDTNAMLGGIDIRITDYITFNLSIFYFDFDMDKCIPFREGYFGGEHATLDIDQQEKYFLPACKLTISFF